MKKFIYLISCLLLVGVCSCGEDALTPSEPMSFGEFPQGNRDLWSSLHGARVSRDAQDR